MLKISRRDVVMVVSMMVLCIVLTKLDFFPRKDPEPGRKERARVLSVDNSGIMETGLLRMGSQILKVEVLSGRWKGETFRASNQLRAQMELDKLFEKGDVILVGILDDATPEQSTLNAQDHYRTSYTIFLFLLFAALLLAFGGLTGFCALLSFVFTALVIWRLVVPLCLMGWNAIFVSFIAVALLSVVIIFLVAGLNRKGVTAFSGAFCGVLASSVLAYVFVHLFKINGAVMPYSQALLYSGYEYLSLSDIYVGAIFLASSGAVMDLAMDVAAGMEEISNKNPDLPPVELLYSGIRIGRAVVGTMTTTLLLAYSGGYLTLLMTFAAQGTSPIDCINNPYIASETVKTLIGSFGLVLVAPFTALIGTMIYGRNRTEKFSQ